MIKPAGDSKNIIKSLFDLRPLTQANLQSLGFHKAINRLTINITHKTNEYSSFCLLQPNPANAQNNLSFPQLKRLPVSLLPTQSNSRPRCLYTTTHTLGTQSLIQIRQTNVFRCGTDRPLARSTTSFERQTGVCCRRPSNDFEYVIPVTFDWCAVVT